MFRLHLVGGSMVKYMRTTNVSGYIELNHIISET